jgi:hypothetical protein
MGAICLSIHPSVHRPIICLSCIYPSICLSIHSSIHPSIHHYVSVYLCLFASIHFLSTCLTFYSFIYLSIYLRNSLCLHLSIPTQNLNFFYLLACTTFEKQHTFCQQSTPDSKTATCPPRVTLLHVSFHVPGTDTWPCIYTLRVAFVSISHLCTSLCVACTYESRPVRSLKLLVTPFPVPSPLHYCSMPMALKGKREFPVQFAEMRWLRRAKRCAL